MLAVDLHTHSTRSDGTLTPTALVGRAAGRGVRALALTDHDETAGLVEAGAACAAYGIVLVPGVEVSVTWHGVTLHVLGLGIDPSGTRLRDGLDAIRRGRAERARAIGERLASAGVPDAYPDAERLAGDGAQVGRTHFARVLVARGLARDNAAAFRRYLAEGRPGHVRHRWPALAEAVDWILQAGGVAVLAHPARYGLRPARMVVLLDEFRALGGGGIEAVTASHTPEEARWAARLARERGLAVSAGSDFHGPGASWWDVGELPALPDDCEPVWERLIDASVTAR